MNKILVQLLFSSFFILPTIFKTDIVFFDLVSTGFLIVAFLVRFKFLVEFRSNLLFLATLATLITISLVSFEQYHFLYVLQGVVGVVFTWVLVQDDYLRVTQRTVSFWILVINVSAVFFFSKISFLVPIGNSSNYLFNGVFRQENAQMLFLVLSFFFLIYQLYSERLNESNWKKFTWFNLVITLFSMFLASGSKVGLLGLSAGFGLLLLLLYLPKFNCSKLQSSLLLLFLTLSSVWLLIYVTSNSLNIALTSRVQTWKVALKMGWENPLGVGLGEFPLSWNSYLNIDEAVHVSGKAIFPESAHNFFLSAFSELGWGGLFLLSGLVLIAYVNVWNLAWAERKFFDIVWVSSLTALIVISSLTTVVWTQGPIRFVFWVVLGLSWFYYGPKWKFEFFRKYVKLAIIFFILLGSVSTYYYGRFLYSEYLLHQYGSMKNLKLAHFTEVNKYFSLSAPSHREIAKLYIQIGEYEEAKKRLDFVENISGGLFNVSELRIEIAKKQSDIVLEEKLIRTYLYQFPKENVKVWVRYLEILAIKNDCKEFIRGKNNALSLFIMPNLDFTNFEYKKPWFILNSKLDSLIQKNAFEIRLKDKRLMKESLVELSALNCEEAKLK